MSGLKTALAAGTASLALMGSASAQRPPELENANPQPSEYNNAQIAIAGIIKSESCLLGFNATAQSPRYSQMNIPPVNSSFSQVNLGPLHKQAVFTWGLPNGYQHGSLSPEESAKICGEATYTFSGNTKGEAMQAAAVGTGLILPVYKHARDMIREGLLNNVDQDGNANTPEFNAIRDDAAMNLAKVFSVMSNNYSYNYQPPAINMQVRRAPSAAPTEGSSVPAQPTAARTPKAPGVSRGI